MKAEQWLGVCVRLIRFLQWNWKIWEYIYLYIACSRLTLKASVAPANTYQIHSPAASTLRAAAAVTASHFWQSVSTSNLCHCRQPTQLRPLCIWQWKTLSARGWVALSCQLWVWVYWLLSHSCPQHELNKISLHWSVLKSSPFNNNNKTSSIYKRTVHRGFVVVFSREYKYFRRLCTSLWTELQVRESYKSCKIYKGMH